MILVPCSTTRNETTGEGPTEVNPVYFAQDIMATTGIQARKKTAAYDGHKCYPYDLVVGVDFGMTYTGV